MSPRQEAEVGVVGVFGRWLYEESLNTQWYGAPLSIYSYHLQCSAIGLDKKGLSYHGETSKGKTKGTYKSW